jgi:hypothetical protein
MPRAVGWTINLTKRTKGSGTIWDRRISYPLLLSALLVMAAGCTETSGSRAIPSGSGDSSSPRVTAARLLAYTDDQAHSYLRWLRSVAADHVFLPDFMAEVKLLVPELLRHEVISGRRARQIIKEGGEAG